MSPEIDIDVDGSLRRNRLQIKPVWLEYLDTFTVLTLATFFIILPIALYGQVNKSNPNDRVFAYVLFPILILSGLSLFYKKLREKSLVQIKTMWSKAENKVKIIEFLNSEGFRIIEDKENIIIGLREGDIISWPRQFNVLFDHSSIKVCILTLNLKARMPSFFESRSLIKSLRKFLTK